MSKSPIYSNIGLV